MSRRKFDLTAGIRHVIAPSPSVDEDKKSTPTQDKAQPSLSPVEKTTADAKKDYSSKTTTISTSISPTENPSKSSAQMPTPDVQLDTPSSHEMPKQTPHKNTPPQTKQKGIQLSKLHYEKQFTKIRLRQEIYQDLRVLCQSIPGLSIQDAVEMSLRGLLTKKDAALFLRRQARKYLNRF